MDKLNPALVATVSAFLNGNRREKFLASVKVLNDSLAQGGWITRGSVKAQSGFYQGLATKLDQAGHFELYMCLRFGQVRFTGEVPDKDIEDCGVPSRVGQAWVALCREVKAARQELDLARPLPKITAIGLSPKVTATLTECNLDLDINTIRLAKIDFKLVQDRDEKTRALKFDRDGNPVMIRLYFVAWTPGIKHSLSRFAQGGHCHACGKFIPSCRFVPVEATCKRNGLVSMLLGCDCSRNIFGIQDVGISPDGLESPDAGV
jgi:hypothetical protein